MKQIKINKSELEELYKKKTIEACNSPYIHGIGIFEDGHIEDLRYVFKNNGYFNTNAILIIGIDGWGLANEPMSREDEIEYENAKKEGWLDEFIETFVDTFINYNFEKTIDYIRFELEERNNYKVEFV